MALTLSKNALHSALSRVMSCVVAISTVASMPFAYADVELNGQKEALSSQEQVNVVLNGKFTQGALLRGQAPAGAKVTLNGETVQTNKDGKFVVGFEREAPLQQTLVVKLDNGQKWQRDITLEKREYNIQRIDGLEQKMVSPPAEVTARIKQDNINVANARSGNTDLDALFTRFEWPAKGVISGVYGSQRILNGVPKWPHYGLDIANETGTPVYAPVDGVVTMADDLYYSGNTLILDHGMRVFSTFLHMDTITVEVGETVKQGEQIGTIGSTGRSTGPHLDWRINLGNTRLDPQTIISGSPEE
ncbi:MAG: M23 family metallopeptidase [Alteromonas macleodii]|uniref:M23 family metallopeptidase n=1 Tax=Alteromonas TaxID=226 RepID=UPI000776D970|nr:M23 family metallopeptidase [Alteromonas macleodii]AMN11879.1 peptidase [Alteromonas macleodii]MDM7964355.1 M23 family metallopeptidase [Alteromonas macleodii]MDM8171263.1 M23 family metallopeptidase [Alteromonas macleodii]CAI3956410.1 peptidase M23-like protein [Alteromonas macleodii]VTP55220.1 peptidase M23-like protein [Alteromonas macleodii]|tara:strand:- start:850 stop:1758 length:909 start_codon:yes stop_codon:yes gene_type:complete